MWEHGFTYWVFGFSRVSESHDCQDYHGWTRDSVPIKASLDCIWNVGIGIVNISLYFPVLCHMIANDAGGQARS
jgi:hypothetical protein